ncbi:hypothetical protein [Paenibacillus sp. N3.4]|uniref:hypothetical protein n=1 Tax=Paenibacillus sp. N3.4 TaxID=2603222 RepID=UPI0011CBDB15|nr:hypothetical protein [Paenibacillus sp. N3.4]TXK71479.1 hypothetical protein FU659_33060 [Paenibacillus sp. N3.4]
MNAKIFRGIISLFIIGVASLLMVNHSEESQSVSELSPAISAIVPTPSPSPSSIPSPFPTPSKDVQGAIVETTASPTENEMNTYLAKVTNDESIRKDLYALYGRFNALVGNFDNHKKTSSEEWKQLLEYNFLKTEVYERFAEVTSSDELRKDFKNAAQLVAKARKGIEHGRVSDDELKALRYAYEVVNDVQAWSLPQGGENLKVRHKFGASYALDDHKQVSIIEKWITNHK